MDRLSLLERSDCAWTDCLFTDNVTWANKTNIKCNSVLLPIAPTTSYLFQRKIPLTLSFDTSFECSINSLLELLCGGILLKGILDAENLVIKWNECRRIERVFVHIASYLSHTSAIKGREKVFFKVSWLCCKIWRRPVWHSWCVGAKQRVSTIKNRNRLCIRICLTRWTKILQETFKNYYFLFWTPRIACVYMGIYVQGALNLTSKKI